MPPDIHAHRDIELTYLGPQNDDSSVVLCLEQKYTIVFECVVVDAANLVWDLMSVLEHSMIISRGTEVGELDHDSPVKIILSKKVVSARANETFFISQLHVSTESLRNAIIDHDYPLNVTCRASDEFIRSISIRFSGIFNQS